MSGNVLIGTLGTRPGVVTATLDCFARFAGVQFDKVILVSTNHPEITQGYEKLQGHFQQDCQYCRQYYSKGLQVCLDTISANEAITDEDNNELLRKILYHLHATSSPDTDIYLSLSGGRKHMSAILTFAGLLHPVKGIYHVTPDNDDVFRQAEREREIARRGRALCWLTWHYEREYE